MPDGDYFIYTVDGGKPYPNEDSLGIKANLGI